MIHLRNYKHSHKAAITQDILGVPLPEFFSGCCSKHALLNSFCGSNEICILKSGFVFWGLFFHLKRSKTTQSWAWTKSEMTKVSHNPVWFWFYGPNYLVVLSEPVQEGNYPRGIAELARVRENQKEYMCSLSQRRSLEEEKNFHKYESRHACWKTLFFTYSPI